MPLYKIADLIVSMTPQYEKMCQLMNKYEVQLMEKADINITLSKQFFYNACIELSYLSLSDIENIYSLSQFSAQLAGFNGIVLHGSAIVYNGNGYIFSGNSGIGKSTHTQLWQRYFGDDAVTVLNDDKPAIRVIKGKPYVYGTPWCGDSYVNTNDSAPLRAVVFLDKADNNTVQLITNTVDKVYKLIEQSKRKYEQQDLNKILSVIDQLINTVDFYNAQLTPGITAVTAVHDVICNTKQQ